MIRGKHGYVKGEITEKGVRTQWVRAHAESMYHLDLTVEPEDTTGSIRRQIKELISEYERNIYKIVLKGKETGMFSGYRADDG